MTVAHPPGVPGIDIPRFAAWLARSLPAAGSITAIEVIAGGRSNLTYRVELATAEADPDTDTATDTAVAAAGGLSRVVVRRPPLGHVLPTAHDMGREYRVLSALADSAVPVPRPLALCPDEDVIGAPFYVMEYVTGHVLRTAEDAAAAGVTADQARALSGQLVDVLANIHLLDVEAAGLADFGRPAGYLARQLRRWGKQWESSHAARVQAAGKPDELPEYDRLAARLAARLPAAESASAALVHGDYRLDNALVQLAPEPLIAAVVDWEMSTLGDPLADLGLSLVYWADPDDEERLAIPVGSTVTSTPGFGTGQDFAERYAAQTGFDLTDLDFYVAFGCFKLAVVLEGINARFLQNATVGEGFAEIGAAVPVLIDRAHRILDARSPWPR
jgi:aminoglycoside phosphotransferase (APT) family kinase protein